MLKIQKYTNEIAHLLKNYQVTMLSTSTGSGKTMYTPWLAGQISGECVFVLMPRVIMALQAQRGVIALGLFKASEVAILTGRKKTYVAGQTKICFCTEISFLNSGLIENLDKGYVVIDEVHEAKASTSAILHKSKTWLEKGLKIVLLSATVDIPKYQRYYEGYTFGYLNEPESERPYNVIQIDSPDPIRACYDAAKEGGRVLIGTAGKPDIDKYIRSITSYGKDVKVFQLHGEMEQEDTNVALEYMEGCIYVATNIVQSGVTLHMLTHLYIDGTGNRIESQNGVSKLVKYNLSEAEMKQWRGRIGRMCDGVEIVDPATKYVIRDVMPTAEILIVPLMETYATFLNMGVDMENVILLDTPKEKEIISAKNALEKLNVISNGKLTTFGQSVLTLGVGVRAGIISVIGKTLQIENVAAKINAIDQVGHPFRNFNKGAKTPQYSDYVFWIEVIEDFIERYGYNVNQLDYPLFEQECTEKGIFRKNLSKLMRIFQNIDEVHQYKELSDKKVKCLLYLSNLDRIVINNFLDNTYITLSNKSVIQREAVFFGNIISIGNKTFVEGATSISLEEKTIFDQLL